MSQGAHGMCHTAQGKAQEEAAASGALACSSSTWAELVGNPLIQPVGPLRLCQPACGKDCARRDS